MKPISGGPPTSAFPATYVAFILVQLVSSSGLTTLYIVLTSLYREYANASGVGWAVTAYLLTSASGSALCGRLGDLLGRRRMVQIALAIAGSGAAVSAFAPNLVTLIAGCALQGLAGSLAPLTIGLARETLPPRSVSLAVGIISAAGIAGAGVSYLFAGWVTDHFASHGAFLMKTVLAAIAMLTVARLVPASPACSSGLERIDFVRGTLFAPAIAGMLIGIEHIREWGWAAGGLVISCLILLMFWARHQLRQTTPLINIRLLLERRVLLANGAMVCIGMGCLQVGQMLALLMQQPLWTKAGFGLSATSVGWMFLLFTSTSVVASPVSGKIAGRHGARRAALYGAVVLIAAWSIIAGGHAYFPVMIGAALANMIGLSFVFTSIYNLILEATPPERTSEATGMASVFQAIAMAVASQILFKVLASSTVSDPLQGPHAYPSSAAYTLAFVCITVMCVLCLFALLAIPRRNSVPSTETIRSVPVSEPSP